MQATLCACRQVVFDNTKPRLDSTGSILKAHDGTTQRFAAAAVATPLDGVGGGSSSNLFYYHAMGYPACNETGRINGCNYDPVYGKGAKTCIYGHNNSLLVYSSPDLSSGSWKLEDTVYPGHSVSVESGIDSLHAHPSPFTLFLFPNKLTLLLQRKLSAPHD